MIHCSLCDNPSHKTGAAGIYLTPGGRPSPWQLCPACALKFQSANETQRAELLVLIEATISENGACE